MNYCNNYNRCSHVAANTDAALSLVLSSHLKVALCFGIAGAALCSCAQTPPFADSIETTTPRMESSSAQQLPLPPADARYQLSPVKATSIEQMYPRIEANKGQHDQYQPQPALQGQQASGVLAMGNYVPPAGSQAPYYSNPMTANPSLWPDDRESVALFRDFRAFRPKDILTVIIIESSEGKKKADTDAETKFSFLASIGSFFGLETSKWESNNAGLNADSLISAKTNSKFEGQGETNRKGSLQGKIAVVVKEVQPNGILTIEGKKIISVNNEEEVMSISGFVRPEDIDAINQVPSPKIANMRIDFYGNGVIADEQKPGWGYRLLRVIWPF